MEGERERGREGGAVREGGRHRGRDGRGGREGGGGGQEGWTE